MITLEYLQAELGRLHDEQARIKKELVRSQAALHIYLGAIELCKELIMQEEAAITKERLSNGNNQTNVGDTASHSAR